MIFNINDNRQAAYVNQRTNFHYEDNKTYLKGDI